MIGKLPTCMGTPESVPSAASVTPAGSVPLARVNVAVPMAPLCVNVAVNGVPAVPVLVDGFVTVMVWHVIVRLYVGPDPVQPFASVTVTTIGKLPVCVGV